jgi:hypothetical protein
VPLGDAFRAGGFVHLLAKAFLNSFLFLSLAIARRRFTSGFDCSGWRTSNRLSNDFELTQKPIVNFLKLLFGHLPSLSEPNSLLSKNSSLVKPLYLGFTLTPQFDSSALRFSFGVLEFERPAPVDWEVSKCSANKDESKIRRVSFWRLHVQMFSGKFHCSD